MDETNLTDVHYIPECYDAHDVLMSALSHGRDGFSRQPIQELSVAYLPLEEAGDKRR